MVRRIPQGGQWTGIYSGDVSGDVWKTFNIDLNRKPGHIALSERFLRIQDTFTDCSSFTAFLRSDADCTDRYWALASANNNGGNGYLIKTDSASLSSLSPNNDWDTDPLDSTPTDPLDFTIHGKDSRNDSGRDKIFVTRDTGDIAVLNDTGNNAWTGSWWVGKHSQPALNVNVTKHPIEYMPFRKITLVGDGNLIHTISRPSDTQNDTVTYARLVLPPQYEARHIFMAGNRAWINCFHKAGGNGAVVEWDGFSQTYNNLHEIPGAFPHGGVSNNGNPTVVSSKGQIMEFVGDAFAPMNRGGRDVNFPVFDQPVNSIIGNPNDSNGLLFLQPRGMVIAEDGLIYMNLRQPAIDSPNQGAGIWCLDPKTGILNNKYSFSTDTVGDTTLGITYGHQFIDRAGALYPLPSQILGMGLLAGATLYDTAVNTAGPNGLWVLSPPLSASVGALRKATNRGYFVTPFIYASEIKEFWDTLWLRFNRSRSDVSQIVVKARGVRPLIDGDYDPITANGTWTSTTTFTVTLNTEDDSLQVGDEIEVIGGANAGRTAHITTISGAHGALQTITIDEVMPSGSSSSHIRFDRWKKLKTFSVNSKYEEMANIGIDSSFIQFKVELHGPASDMVVKDLTVSSKSSINLAK